MPDPNDKALTVEEKKQERMMNGMEAIYAFDAQQGKPREIVKREIPSDLPF